MDVGRVKDVIGLNALHALQMFASDANTIIYFKSRFEARLQPSKRGLVYSYLIIHLSQGLKELSVLSLLFLKVFILSNCGA